MSRRSSGRVWITSNMADRRGWVFALALILALIGLATHVVYDAACPLPKASGGTSCALGSRPAAPGGGQAIAHFSHAGAVAPARLSLAAPVAIVVALRRVDLKPLSRSLPPPFQPPRIARVG